MAFITKLLMFNSYSVWGHATSILSHYFNGHKLAFDQTPPDLSHITMQPETELDFEGNVKKIQHVCHCTVKDYSNGRLCLKSIGLGLLVPDGSLVRSFNTTVPNDLGKSKKKNMEKSKIKIHGRYTQFKKEPSS